MLVGGCSDKSLVKLTINGVYIYIYICVHTHIICINIYMYIPFIVSLTRDLSDHPPTNIY